MSKTYTQSDRLIRIDTSLGEDALLLQGFTGGDGISSLFRFDLELLSVNRGISFADIVGKPATITIHLADGKPRYYNGMVSRFSQGGMEQHLYRYNAELVPKLWFLKRSVNCRVFQAQTATEIIETVLKESGVTDYKLTTQKTYPSLEYCVQYRETNFNFISRLMEEQGIFYFFEHEATKHTMILGDKPSAHPHCADQRAARLDIHAGGLDEEDVITVWETGQEFRSGKYSLADYNFEQPALDLSASVASTVSLQGIDSFEIYDYPGGFKTKAEGDTTVGTRMEEEESAHKIIEGAGVCRSFGSGYKFDLEEHFRRDLNGSYVLTQVRHSASVGSNYLGGTNIAETYSNKFRCIPYAVPYRPPLTSIKPVVQGLQTAVVVGPGGEEIYTDKYGRVKVQFHWDRVGKYDDKSSCWIRVTTPVAGKRWGSVFIPRIGWEVVVAFEEGDPDRPLIIGSVYNATQMPPYALPDSKTKSALKTYSSKGGGGFNEIRMDDTKGKEQIFIHGEHDLHLRIKNEVRETILNDRHTGITGNEYSEVKKDSHVQIKGDENQKVDGSVSLKAGMNLLQKVGQKFAADAGTEIHLKAGTNLVIESGATLTLKVGGNFINLNSGGVFIKGTMVMINSGGAAGSGSGCSPQPPEAPKEADTAEAGAATQLPPSKEPPKPKAYNPAPLTYSPAALVMKQAAQDGTPFCLICPQCVAP